MRISSPTKRAMMKTGNYLGDGVDDRNMDIGVNLAVKLNVYVIIVGGNAEPVHRIEYGQGDLSMRYEPLLDVVNCIQSFTATGFQLGNDPRVNLNEYSYRYIALWEEP